MSQRDTGSSESHVGRQVGTYRIMEAVGRGGMGEVYRAWDDKLGRPVAVKALPPSMLGDETARKRFVRETRVACRVVHPYVATVFDVVEQETSLFLVMEYLEGRRLDHALRDESVGLEETTRWGLEIAEALAAIHKTGLVHRDLKPANVMITPEGHVKVMDFGVAFPMHPPDFVPTGTSIATEPRLTGEGLGVGTISYMSPEQIRGAAIDPRSDLFALGILLYEAVTRVHPFLRESVIGTAQAILNEPPAGGTEPPTLAQSGALRQIVLRLLEKDRDRRYATADQVVEDLQAVLRGEVPPFGAAGTRLGPWGKLGLGVGALAVTAAAVGLLLIGGKRPSPPPVDGRAGIVVLPLRGTAGEADAALRGSLVASLLRAELTQSDALRIVGATRTDEIVAGVGGSRPAPEALGGMLDAAAARFLVTGDYINEQGQILAAIEIYDRENPNAVVALRNQSTSLAGLVDGLASEVRRKLAPAAAAALDRGKRALESASEPALAAAERGRAALRRGDLVAAVREYDTAVQDDPKFFRALLERAKALYAAGYTKRAREAAAEASDVASSLERPLPECSLRELEGIRARIDEDREAEIRAFRRLVDRYPDDPEVWTELAKAYNSGNRHPEALEAIDRALALGPAAPDVRIARAFTLTRLGKLADARADTDLAAKADEALPGRPYQARVLAQRAYLAMSEKDYAAAKDLYLQAEALELRDGSRVRAADMKRAAAQADLIRGRLTEAERGLEEATQAFADAGQIRYEAFCLDSLGATFFQQGRFQEAEKVLRTALDKARMTGADRPLMSPLLNLSNVLIAQGETDEPTLLAKEAERLAAAAKDNPRLAAARLALGSAELNRGRLAAADAEYQEALSILPADRPESRLGWAWLSVAELRGLQGRLAEALAASDRGIATHRSVGESVSVAYGLIQKAGLCRTAGDASCASAALTEMEKLAGDIGSNDLATRIQLERGQQALEASRAAEAAGLFLRVLQAKDVGEGVMFDARTSLARELAMSGKAAEAVNEASRALEETKAAYRKIQARAELARCLRLAGRYADARAAALRTIDDAEVAGMRWEVARGAAEALSLPVSERPASEAAVRERGVRALRGLLDDAPGGADGPVSKRPEVRQVKKVLTGRASEGARAATTALDPQEVHG